VASQLDSERSRKVFVVHGRNKAARVAMFTFLRAIGLSPIEWSQALAMSGQASPYIGDVLDAALEAAQAVVVLLTPDEIASLRAEYADGDEDPDATPSAQARPNVLFEAGLALGRAPKRTVLAELGKVRRFSDIAGRHVVRIGDSVASRQEIAARLRTAGCAVDLTGTDWHTAGDFTPPPPLMLASGVGSPSDLQQSRPAATVGPATGSAERITLSNFTVKDAGRGTYEVNGEATNNEGVEYSALLKATFYDPDGRIIGTATGIVNQLSARETKTFTLTTTGEVRSYASIKVQVDTLI
jgi:Predicted nucleotide-binding protein containing TIR-like domain